MNGSGDVQAQTLAEGKTLFMAAIGAPRSAKKYLAIQWGAVVAQLLFFVALNHWVASPPLRMALILASVVVSLKLLGRLSPPSLQLRAQSESGVRVSGRFEQRHIPLHKATAMTSVAAEGNRIVFHVQGENGNETVSLNGEAFAALGTRTLHDLASAILDRDTDAFASIAEANNLKLRRKPRAIGVSSVEPRWLHLALLIGSMAIIVAFYTLRHYFLR